MEEIIHAVFAEISNCSHPEHRIGSSTSLRACVDAKAESLARTSIYLVGDRISARDEIKDLVHQAIQDCGEAMDEIGYDSSLLVQQCLLKRGDRLVDMAVDLLTEEIPSEDYVVEMRKHRCSRRKKSISRRKKKSARKIRWKK